MTEDLCLNPTSLTSAKIVQQTLHGGVIKCESTLGDGDGHTR